MIDPVIFTIRLFGFEWPVRWYGVIVMVGIIVGSLIVERQLKRRGENSELIWDALVWILIPGIIGARLWFVMNATLGGDPAYSQNPSEIFRIWNGGLHIFGGLLFGGIALLTYLRWNKLDAWLFLDLAGPAMLIGQAIGRIANFINQELYGPPTTLPWGIKIDANHRLAEFADLNKYPVETTRFHPTFAYEMLWNFFAAGLLLWLSRRYEKDLKPGALFSGWLLLAGFGRVVIEFFRPDQPKIEGLGISYSSIAAALMAVTGAIMLMIRYKAINAPFAEGWEEEYQLSTQVNKPPVEVVEEEQEEVVKVKTARKAAPARPRTATVKRATKAKPVVKETGKPEIRSGGKTNSRAKKSS
ncbi:MAG: prolipoprotein diacylglyceryl transferase [Chloroflexi bacterium]|nr:prolipoprotein diacylglyceryl transferase [Chloroflexota bacterium]